MVGVVAGAGIGAARSRARRALSAAALLAGAAGVLFAVAPSSGAAPSTVVRHAGGDRYETAAAISAATFADPVPVVFVATGLSFPDALAGGPAAGVRGGPILLVAEDEVPPATADELDRLSPAEIVVLGGEGAVSAELLDGLEALAPGATTRVAGGDRYETAAAISAATFEPGVPMAYLATGAAFPDALPGGAAGANVGGPVLLVDGEVVSDAVFDELVRLEPAAVTILGGTDAVPDGLLEEIELIAGVAVTRIAGGTRYETATALSAATFPDGAASVFVATGAAFPDALAGGPAAGVAGAPLLLVPGDCAPQSVIDEVDRLGAETMVVLGGTNAVGPAVEALEACATDADGTTTTTSDGSGSTTTTAPSGCDPAYPDFCIPPPPAEVDCADLPEEDFTVLAPDPHGFDADGNGIGCESAGSGGPRPPV